MKDPYLLHMFNPTKNVSPFDVNMAYEAEFDGVIPYAEVVLEDIHALTQDTIFSRGSKGVKRTGIFIGGRDFGLACDMLARARVAMVPPFEVSVFADPSGAITTAAAILASIEHCLERNGWAFKGESLYVFGGTGPVGTCLGVLACKSGLEVHLLSRRGKKVSEEFAAECNARFGVQMKGAGCGSEEEIEAAIADASIIACVAKAGVQVLSKDHLSKGGKLLAVADANAVPPAGVEGVDAKDFGVPLDDTPRKALALGALAAGDIKYKTHFRIFQDMKRSEKPLYIGHDEAFEIARQIVRGKYGNG